MTDAFDIWASQQSVQRAINEWGLAGPLKEICCRSGWSCPMLYPSASGIKLTFAPRLTTVRPELSDDSSWPYSLLTHYSGTKFCSTAACGAALSPIIPVNWPIKAAVKVPLLAFALHVSQLQHSPILTRQHLALSIRNAPSRTATPAPRNTPMGRTHHQCGAPNKQHHLHNH